MSKEIAKYRVLRLSHIHNNLWPEGSEIEYDGEPGSALEPLNDAAKAAKKAVEEKGKPVAVQQVVTPAEPTNTDLNSEGSGNDGAGGDGGGTGGNQVEGDLDQMREEYEALFNEKPHHNTKAETLREKIAEKRKELGL